MEKLTTSIIEQYIKIVEQHAIVSITDVDGKIVYANNLFEEVSGYSKKELIGNSHRIIRSDKNQDDLFKKMWATISKGHIWHGNICNKKKDGSLYWVKSTVAPIFDEKNKIKNYIAIRTEITNEKLLLEETEIVNSEQDNIFNIIPCGVAILKNRVIVKCNQEFERMLGYDQGELIGKDTRTIYLSDGQYFGVGVLAYSKQDNSKFEVKLKKKDGSFIWVSAGCIGIFKDDPMTHAVYAIVDITKQKQQEIELCMHRDHLQDMIEERVVELIEEKNKIEESYRFKNEIISTISQEIKTPLHAITSFADLGIKLVHNEKTGIDKFLSYFEGIKISGEKIIGLVNNVLDMQKLETGKMDVYKENCNLKDIVMNSICEQEALIINKDINITYELADNCYREVDKSLIHQLISNLLFNAIKFTPQSNEVHIKLINQFDKIVLQVIDSGVGIPDDELEVIFNKLTQNQYTRRNSGTGLGLAICAQIVELHSGTISARNRKDKAGAIFEVILPKD